MSKNLFGEEGHGWQKEWVGMPEFVQTKQRPVAQIIFRFETEEDVQELADLIGQKLTCLTKSAWYPPKSHFRAVHKEWADES